MTQSIITNNKPRPIMFGYELTAKERLEFDYYTSDELNDAEFFRYRGQMYDLGEFMPTSGNLRALGWQGIATDTYFSGTIVRIDQDGEYVIVGRCYS